MTVFCVSDVLPSYLCVIIIVMFVISGAGGALRPSGVPVAVGGRGRSGVHQSAGGEARKQKQDVQRNKRGDAGAASAPRQQEGPTNIIRLVLNTDSIRRVTLS